MLIVTPNFHLNGQCEEAISLYKKAFDAEIMSLLRYGDADPRDWQTPLTDRQKNLIYHAEMRIGNQRIMLSDILDFDLQRGNSLFLSITFPDARGVKEAYEILKDGGQIVYPMKNTTYSSCIVSLIDKYGFRWVLMTEQPG